MEGALGYLGKYLGHGVRSVFRLHLRVGHHIPAVVPELVSQEEVCEVNLSQDVGKVEELTDEEAEGIQAVGASVEAPVLDNVVNLGENYKIR